MIERRYIIRTQAGIIRGCAFIGILLLGLFKVHGPFAEERSSMDRFMGDEELPWEITAESLSYDEEEGAYIAKGDVVIKKADETLRAQEAIYQKKTGIVRVSGDVRLEAAGDVLQCEQGIFNLKDQTGKIFNGLLFLRENHYYIRGDVIEKLAKDTYLVKNCLLTTCDGTTPDWSITGSEVRVTVEGYGKVKHAAFRIRELPVLYVPYLVFPAKTKRQTGLLPPRVGYSDQNGMDVEVPFFWAISDQIDATFYERYMSERGYMQGLEFRYIADQDSKGTFFFDVLSDRIEDKDLADPDQMEVSPDPRTNQTRYWFRSKTDQQLPWRILARLDADFVSDQDYLREFEGELSGFEARPDFVRESGRPLEERFSPTRRSALRLSHDGESYSLHGSAGYHQRPENPSNDEAAQPLGGLDFALLPRPVPHLPLTFKFDTDYQYIWCDMGTKGHSLSFSPKLSYPMWFGRYLEFESSASYTMDIQWLDDPIENVDHQSKEVYQLETRLSSTLERIFDLGWNNAAKLKHKVRPILTYSFKPPRDEADKQQPWFEVIDWIDSGRKTNRISFGIQNFLDARLDNEEGEATYRQWATLSLSQGYDINEARRDEAPGREKEPFEPLLATMTLRPFPGLYFKGLTTWDHDENKATLVDLSLYLSMPRSRGRRDGLYVDYRDVAEGNDSLRLMADVNLAYGFSAGASLNRDLELQQNIHSNYWLGYGRQCWAVRLAAEEEDEETRVMVTFGLLGIGWW